VKSSAQGSFGLQLRSLRETAGFTQEELATIAGISVHAVSALERGERRRPHVETVRALSAALDLTGDARDALLRSARAPARPAAADELSAGALPLPLTALLGREAELQTLRLWLADRDARLITLTGPGGAGKTRLALELARALGAEGEARVVFVPLATIRDPAFVAPAIAEALGPSDATALDLPERARRACGGQPTLLVLDNFEQILDAAPLVANLLTSIPSLRLLTTSRAPLRVRGEREYALGPLAFDTRSDALPPADLARIPAVRLFLERVRDGQADFRLTPTNGPIVAAICRRLDALPLAIELAAPWLKVLTPEDLLRRLEHDALLSTAGPRDLPERQQTMNATLGWSYQLLDADARSVFRRLGALPGRFSIEAAAAVLADRDESPVSTDDALDAVVGLIDRSLLLRADASPASPPLYQMLETVRAYASLQLTAAEREQALRGLVGYCTGEASRAAKELVGPAQAVWLDRVRDHLANYRAALTCLVERGRAAEASDIASGLVFFWLIRGHAAEGLRWYEQILKLPSLPATAESKALYGAALAWFSQGELARARTAITRSLAIARDAGATELIAQAENLAGYVEHAAGNMSTAGEHFARSIEIFRALASPWGTGNALNGLARVALAQGDLDEAERLLDEATSALRRAGPWFLSLTLSVRGTLAVRRGRPAEALAFARESLVHVRALHDKYAFAYALAPVAEAAVLKGHAAFAARIIGVWDAVTERAGAPAIDKSVQERKEQAEQKVRARLGPQKWDRAYGAGRTISIDSLIRDIDSAL
jgi:predicted ATPase/DNA-binding XRE family transcriptional regulator